MRTTALFAVLAAALAFPPLPLRSAEKDEPALPGDKLVDEILKEDVRAIGEGVLGRIRTAAEWEAERGRLHREYLEMLGLWPLPEKTPLEARTTGTLERDGFRVEKVHFQSRPGLYVTGNLYLPRTLKERAPAVLYLCGHSGRGRDGNKAAFQHHGMWFATHGYVCLIIDTLQLGEVAGIHHGTYRYNRWWWQARGYTPAGVECWNAVRALDYLESRPEVDASRIAATGISGGGAATFWVTAADPRVKVAVPVSGMGDLETYVSDRIIDGHCDCMLLINSHRWEWTTIAALAAPRPLLFANSDQDPIFPMSGNERIAARLRRLYGLLNRPEAFQTVVVPGGHDDKPALRLAAYRFIGKWLKGEDVEAVEPELPPFEGKELRVFPDVLPADAINDRIDETFAPLARVELPRGADGFGPWKESLLGELRRRTFGAPDPALQVVRFRPPNMERGRRGRRGEGSEGDGERSEKGSEKARERKLWMLVPVLGDTETDWALEFTRFRPYVFHPRGVGESAWTAKHPHYVERSLALLGRSADSGRVRDVALAAVKARESLQGRYPVSLIGRGQAGVIAAYAALLEPAIEEVVVVDPPRSHREGPWLLNVMQVCDIADALGMLAPRRLTLKGASPEMEKRVEAIYAAAGAKDRLKIVVPKKPE